MEKIYMEESKKQRKSVMNLSVVLSFVVSIFAVFSLAMFGIVMNQGTGVSYAAVTSDSFNLKFGDEIIAKSGDNVYSYAMHPYYAGSVAFDNQLFCIERRLNVLDNNGYAMTTEGRPSGQTVSVTTQDGDYTLNGTPDVSQDEGLKYLLAIGQSSAQRKAIDANDNISGWVVQSAIWVYLSEKYEDVEAFKLYEKIDGTNSLSDKRVLDSDTIIINGTSRTDLKGKIRTLVQEANTATIPRVVVSKVDEEVSKTEDGKYYQSSLLTVVATPSRNFNSFDISLSGIEGAIFVDENGNELTTTNVPAGTKFYVRVPAEKVSEEVLKGVVNVTGHFDGVSLLYYKTSDDKFQRLASVKPGDIPGATDIEFVVTPDTGMNTAQTIYFIGLIVLLCGVGIVYANVKPVEAKQ